MELSCIAKLPLLARAEGASRKWSFLMSLAPPSLTLMEGQDFGGERIGVTWTHVRPGSTQWRPLGPDFSSLVQSDWSLWDAGAETNTDKPWLCSFFS